MILSVALSNHYCFEVIQAFQGHILAEIDTLCNTLNTVNLCFEVNSHFFNSTLFLHLGTCEALRFNSNRPSDLIQFERDWPIRKFSNRIGRACSFARHKFSQATETINGIFCTIFCLRHHHLYSTTICENVLIIGSYRKNLLTSWTIILCTEFSIKSHINHSIVT